jgi:hypothetical protein
VGNNNNKGGRERKRGRQRCQGNKGKRRKKIQPPPIQIISALLFNKTGVHRHTEILPRKPAQVGPELVRHYDRK